MEEIKAFVALQKHFGDAKALAIADFVEEINKGAVKFSSQSPMSEPQASLSRATTDLPRRYQSHHFGGSAVNESEKSRLILLSHMTLLCVIQVSITLILFLVLFLLK